MPQLHKPRLGKLVHVHADLKLSELRVHRCRDGFCDNAGVLLGYDEPDNHKSGTGSQHAS